MADRIHQAITVWWPLFLMALAAISGLGGGCTVAVYHALKNEKRFTKAIIAAYAFMGMMSAILAFMMIGYIVGYDNISTVRLVAGSFLWSLVSTALILAQNMSTRWTLKFLGSNIIELKGESINEDQ